MAERSGHEKHDELVSPRAIPKAWENARIRVQEPVKERGEEEDRREVATGKEKGKDTKGAGEDSGEPLNNTLPRAVKLLSGKLLEVKEMGEENTQQRVIEEEEAIDQHPDKGLVSGSSKDGLSRGKATEEGEDEGRSEEGEEGRTPKTIPAPVYVTKAERQEHELTHTPYRSWCDHCVRCRGRNTQHRKAGEEDKKSNVPRVVLDYFFMSHQDEAANENPMLIMLDEKTGDKYARAVGQKGLGGGSEEMQWLVADLHEELKAWGHHGGDGGHIILKSDNENPSLP